MSDFLAVASTLMGVFFSVFVFLVILSFLVIIHELGHFLAAKWALIKVEEFGLGYPPLAKVLFKKWGTVFSLNWVPFGGFVKMEGEDGPADEGQVVAEKKAKSSKAATAAAEAQEGPFYTKPLWQRLIVILAGACINFVFGIVAFAIVFSISGIPELISADRPRIGMITAGSPAAQAGLPLNVEIVAFKQGETMTPVATNQEVIEFVKSHQGEQVTVVTTGVCPSVECGPERPEYTLTIRKESEIEPNQGLIGVMFMPVVKMAFYPWYEMPFRGAWYGLQQAVGLSLFILNILGTIGRDLFTKATIPSDLAGPVGIADQFHSTGVAQQGFLQILSFAGMLSVNLAIMNILPIPALDGGRAVFLLLEKIIGRRRVEKFENQANTIGFGLIVTLLMVVTARDIFRIISRIVMDFIS